MYATFSQNIDCAGQKYTSVNNNARCTKVGECSII